MKGMLPGIQEIKGMGGIKSKKKQGDGSTEENKGTKRCVFRPRRGSNESAERRKRRKTQKLKGGTVGGESIWPP